MASQMTRRQVLGGTAAIGMMPFVPHRAAAAMPDFAAFNASYATDIALPAFTNLRKSCAVWADNVAAFASSSSGAKLDLALDGFDPVSDAWIGAQQFRMGPLTSAGRAERFSCWPEQDDVIAAEFSRLLASDDPLDLSPSRFSTENIAVQGLPLLERMIYGFGQPRKLRHFFMDLVQDFMVSDRARRRCEIFRAITANLHAIAEEVEVGWSDAIADIGASEMPFSSSPIEATTRFYVDMLNMLQIVTERKIAVPLGADVASERPELGEQWRSGRSSENIRINLTAISRSVLSSAGFVKLLPADRQDLANHVRDAFATLRLRRNLNVQVGGESIMPTPEERHAHQLLWLGEINRLRDILAHELPSAIGIKLP
nr:imelysin family protein [uncultured Dongia sp.]